jgi:hypothetical protein
MGIRKAKDALKKAQAESPNDRRLLSKLKDAIRKKRAAADAPQFPGSHRGY